MAKTSDRDRALSIALDELRAKRVAAGQCRHCGGPLPCWSEFGDYAPGWSYDWGRRFPLYGPRKKHVKS